MPRINPRDFGGGFSRRKPSEGEVLNEYDELFLTFGSKGDEYLYALTARKFGMRASEVQQIVERRKARVERQRD